MTPVGWLTVAPKFHKWIPEFIKESFFLSWDQTVKALHRNCWKLAGNLIKSQHNVGKSPKISYLQQSDPIKNWLVEISTKNSTKFIFHSINYLSYKPIKLFIGSDKRRVTKAVRITSHMWHQQTSYGFPPPLISIRYLSYFVFFLFFFKDPSPLLYLSLSPDYNNECGIQNEFGIISLRANLNKSDS